MHFLTLRKLLLSVLAVLGLGWLVLVLGMPQIDLVERDFTIVGSIGIFHHFPLHRSFGLIWLAVLVGIILWLDRKHNSLVDDQDVQLALLLLAMVLLIGVLLSSLAAFFGAWLSLLAVFTFSWLLAAYFPSSEDYREVIGATSVILAAAFGLGGGFYNGLIHGLVAGVTYLTCVWLYSSGIFIRPTRTA